MIATEAWGQIPPVTSYSDSYGLPRFRREANADQLNEEGSLLGVVGEADISAVIAQDSEELRAAGVSWDRAISVMLFLSAEIARQQLLAAQLDKSSPRVMLPLASFPGVEWKIRGTHFQYSDLIHDPEEYGEGNWLQEQAYDFREVQLTFTDSHGQRLVKNWNLQTLWLMERYHLLEKNNEYAWSGKEIAELCAIFEAREFFQPNHGHFLSEERPGMRERHAESLTFADGINIRFTVRQERQLSLVCSLTDEPFQRNDTNLVSILNIDTSSQGFVSTVHFIQKLRGEAFDKLERWHRSRELTLTVAEDGSFICQLVLSDQEYQTYTLTVDQTDTIKSQTLAIFCEIVQFLAERAQSQESGLFEGIANEVYEAMNLQILDVLTESNLLDQSAS